MLKQQSSEFGQCFISLRNPGTANGECPSARRLVMDMFAWVTWDVSTDLRCSLMFGMDFSARHTATHGWSTVNQHHLATALSLTWSRLRRFQTWAFGVWSCPTDMLSEGADQKRAALSAYSTFIVSCALTWIVLFYYGLQVVTCSSRRKLVNNLVLTATDFRPLNTPAASARGVLAARTGASSDYCGCAGSFCMDIN